MTSSGFLTNGPAVQIADGESGAQDSSEIALASSTADTSISFASCSLAWCWQKRSSAPEGRLARAWLLLLAVNHCLRYQRVWPSSPRVYPLCCFSRLCVWRSGQDGGMAHRSALLVHLCPTDEWSSARTRGE